MLAVEIIRKKRDGQALTKEEIEFFVKGVTNLEIPECQISALTMAVCLRGMNTKEITDMTIAMRDSGSVMKWEGYDRPIIDKHSSGGVGDKLSLMIAPLMAACGGYVPMIAGRGLGHTGGTVDKMEAIPGYQSMPDETLFRKTVKEVGCAIIGQTSTLAPADKRIYSIRDVSGTVESVPLITASILSKKLASGLDGLIMDLKCGNGAFMATYDQAKELAKSIVSVANMAGVKTSSVITDMNQVLGYTIGNAIEVLDAVNYLKGINRETRTHEIVLALCAEVLVNNKLASDIKDAYAKLNQALDSGKAAEIFAKMITALGGPSDFVETPEKYLAKANFIMDVYPLKKGYVTAMKTREIGLLLVAMGGGRTKPDQKLDLSVGMTNFCQLGDYVDENTPLCTVHAKNEAMYNMVKDELGRLITIEDKSKGTGKTVYETIRE